MPTIQFFQPDQGRQFDGPLDLHAHLIRHSAATFFLRVGDEARGDSGVRPDDLLVVDRALDPVSGCVVIASLGGDLRVMRFRPSNETEELQVWGVVTHLIRALP